MVGPKQPKPLPTAGELAVAKVVKAIRPGQVSSYAQVARRASLPAGPRGVARALGRVEGLPWWRVIRSDGTLAPEVAGEQARRLRAEGVEVKGRRVVGAAPLEGERRGRQKKPRQASKLREQPSLPGRLAPSISRKSRKGP